MSTTSVERAAMRRAIALSVLGVGTTSPNPPVGCVILDAAATVVGEGYHVRKGEAHAEANALAAAGGAATGGTAVVTLEPCNHEGRTPPCHQALLDSGVARVVIGLLDPTSRGDGGAAVLRAAGVDVEVGALVDEVALVLGPWLRSLRDRRPQVTWLYRFSPAGLGAVPSAVPALRSGFDAVLDENGRLEEGSQGAHGRDAFTLPAIEAGWTTQELLTTLYGGGVRSLLLHGGWSLAAPFVDAGSMDRVKAHVVDVPGSHRPPAGAAAGASPIPPGFRLERVTKIGDAVVLDAAYDAYDLDV